MKNAFSPAASIDADLGVLAAASAVLPPGLRVFIAEDEAMLVWALTDIIEDFGGVVVGTASRVTEALTFVANKSFDIAILDGALADGAVDPVVEFLAARKTTFVIASGGSSADLKYGACFAVHKPYTESDLKRAMLAALA